MDSGMKRFSRYVAMFGMFALGSFAGVLVANLSQLVSLAILLGSVLYVMFAASWEIFIALRYKERPP